MKVKKKRRLLIFAGVWGVLFIGTFAIHKSWGMSPADNEASSASDNPYAELVRDATRIRLAGLTRRSSGPLVELDEDRNHLLTDGFAEQLNKLNNTLYDCLSKTVSQSQIRTNFLEISFAARQLPRNFSSQSEAKSVTLRISDVVIERSTIRFSPLEEMCLAQALNSVKVEGDRDEPERLTYVMCITRRPHS